MATAKEPLPRTRSSLPERLKNWQDQEMWQYFADTYGKMIYGVAIKAGLSDAEAKDVVQETSIAVSKNIGSYDRKKGPFKNWLFNNVRWRINDQFRKRKGEAGASRPRSPTSTRTPTVERIPNPKDDLEAVWDHEFDKNLSDTALERVKRQVNAKQYQIFDLYVIKEWPAQKVASTLDVNIGRVFLAKHRISALFKKELRLLEKSFF
ncbi:MAG: sigma-70 family RNA polymerase sigma factor [Verrucomicrobiota bacterium]